MVIQGYCDPQLLALREAFTQLMADEPRGAGFALTLDGELVLELWGGCRGREQQQPWQAESLVNLFSAGKGVVSLLILQLVASGHLELDCSVASYWPEFAQSGKEGITVRQLLSHRSGLPILQPEVPDEAVYDGALMASHLAAQAPNWPAGERQAYHPFTFGWLLGELIFRVTGQRINERLQQCVAQPLGIDCYCGVPDAELARCVDLSVNRNAPEYKLSVTRLLEQQPASLSARAFSYPSSLLAGTNSTAWRQGEIPAANMHSNARGLATLYGALANGGSWHGASLLPATLVAQCGETVSEAIDEVLLLPLRFSLGYMLPAPRMGLLLGQGRGSFGHPGVGGAVAFADPEYRIGFAYVPGSLSSAAFGDLRANALIKAVYEVLG